MKKKCVICKKSEEQKKMIIVETEQKIGKKIYIMSVYACSVECIKKYNDSFLKMRRIIKELTHEDNCFTCGSSRIDEDINHFNVDEKGEIKTNRFCSDDCYRKKLEAQSITNKLIKKTQK